MNPIDEFLKGREKRTRINYGWILRQYFREINQNPETYFKKKRDYKKDIDKWWDQHLNEVPKTRHTKLAILRGFLDYNKIVFPKTEWLKLRRKKKGTRAATLDRVPTQAEFKSMLMHGDVKDKALFLFLSSSGMRIDETLKLKESMIELKHDPPLIKIPGNIAKTGDPRITFITQETKGYLEEWLKLRQSYIKTAIRKTKHLCDKPLHDDRVFPFSYDVAWTRWNYLLKKAGLNEKDPTTNRYVLHIHCLRKFFMSQMKLEVPVVIPEALAGHEEYLDEAYRRFTREQLGEYYKKAESRLNIFELVPDLSGVHEELKEKETRINELNQKYNSIKIDHIQMQIDLGKALEEIERIKKKN